MNLPQEITVTRQEVRVDGELLPAPVALDPPPVVAVDASNVPTITVTLMAKRVQVDNDMASHLVQQVAEATRDRSTEARPEHLR